MFQPYNRLSFPTVNVCYTGILKEITVPVSSLIFILPLSLPPKLQQFRLQIKPIRDECATLAGNGAMYFIYLQDKLMHVLSDDYLTINITSYCTVGFFPGN